MAYLVGLDPGKNTGIAVWNTEAQAFVFLDTVQIHEALQLVFRFDVTEGPVDLETVRETISADLLHEKQHEAEEAVIEKWVSEANVKTYPDRLK